MALQASDGRGAAGCTQHVLDIIAPANNPGRAATLLRWTAAAADRTLRVKCQRGLLSTRRGVAAGYAAMYCGRE